MGMHVHERVLSREGSLIDLQFFMELHEPFLNVSVSNKPVDFSGTKNGGH